MSKKTQDESTPRPASKAVGGQRRALIVAINDYKPEINRLPSCIADAERMEALLKNTYGFHSIRKLYNEDATKAGVTQALEELFTGATANDRLVIYFSGHGYQYPVEGVKQEALVLYDGMLSDEAFVEHSKQAPPGVLTVILDSCFSGGMQHAFYVVDEAGEAEAKVKSFIDVDHPQAYSSVDALPVRHFGEPAPEGSASFGEADSDGGLNGVLLSACSKNETAAAGVARTDHLSAFTYALSAIIKRQGPKLSYAALMDGIKAELKSLRFRQTPTLWAPRAHAPMSTTAFLTGEPLPAGLARARSAAPLSNTALASAVSTAVQQVMSRVGGAPAPAGRHSVVARSGVAPAHAAPAHRYGPAPAVARRSPPQQQYSSEDTLAQVLGVMLPALANLVPPQAGPAWPVVRGPAGGYGYPASHHHHQHRHKDFEEAEAFAEYDEDPEDTQQKFLEVLLPGLVSALPQLIQMGTQAMGGFADGYAPQHKDYAPPEAEAFADQILEDEDVQQKFLLLGLLPSLLGMFGGQR